MRPTLLLRLSAALGVAALLFAGQVQASGDGQPPANADITTAKGEIHVKGHPGWHINMDYTWKIFAQDKTKLFDHKKNPDKFEFDKADDKIGGPPHVKVHVPSGSVLISGAICSNANGQCENFTNVPVTVP
jgi:hypothetical protein